MSGNKSRWSADDIDETRRQKPELSKDEYDLFKTRKLKAEFAKRNGSWEIKGNLAIIDFHELAVECDGETHFSSPPAAYRLFLKFSYPACTVPSE